MDQNAIDMTGMVLNRIAGLNVVIRPAEAEVTIVRRSWIERILELPWRPFTPTRKVEHPDAIKRNKEIWRFGNIIHVTPQMEAAVRRELLNKD